MFIKHTCDNANGKKTHWVALVENHAYPADARVRPHIEALAAAGYDVTVISPRAKGQSRYEQVNGVQVYRFFLPAYGSGATSYLIEFLHATLVMTLITLWVWFRHGLDILHVYNPPDTLLIAALLPKLAGKTILFDLRDLSPELYVSKYEKHNPILYELLVWFERVTCRVANHVITTNETYRKIIIERDRLAPSQVSVVRQGPDLMRGYSVEPDADIRSRASIIIGYLGSMAKEDGIDHLLQALHHLDKHYGHQDWYCILIGPTDDLEGLQKLAHELGVQDRVCFTGYLRFEQWISLLSATDICIEPAPSNPVNNISTTNKLMDYMALGKPVIGYGLTEQRVTAGEAALYAKSNDPIDMAKQIAVLMENPELRAQMGALGRKRIEEQLAWQHQKERLLSICESLTEKNSVQVT